MEKMEEKLQRLAPVLTDKELQEINGLFTAYTFRRSKTGELWTTCCGKHKVIREERATAAEEAALYTRHTPVPKYRWGYVYQHDRYQAAGGLPVVRQGDHPQGAGLYRPAEKPVGIPPGGGTPSVAGCSVGLCL